jgi:hypothetical protein
MSTTEILAVDRFPLDTKHLLGCFLDLPTPGTGCPEYKFECAGWVLGKNSPAIGIEILANDGPVRRVPITQQRSDVHRHYPNAPYSGPIGFWTPVSVIGMTPEFELVVQAVLPSARVAIARIRGRHRPVLSKFEPTIQPLMVTSLGRTGTTWLMRLLAEHPAIVAYRVHPYEMRPARYWMQLLSAVTEPAAHAQASSKLGRLDSQWWVAHHPFARTPSTGDPRLQEWFGRRFVEQAAALCQSSVEDCYREVAANQDQPGAVYFAEKHVPDETPGIVWELYPQAREIFLVRDFRDMLCSIQAFNDKRGFIAFGRDLASSDREYILNVKQEAVRLLKAWKSRGSRTQLVHYEDLVQHPDETLTMLLRHLGLESTSAVVQGMIHRASIDTPELRQHRTSQDARSSVGRWRHDQDPLLQSFCEEVFGDVLKELGYAPEEVRA